MLVQGGQREGSVSSRRTEGVLVQGGQPSSCPEVVLTASESLRHHDDGLAQSRDLCDSSEDGLGWAVRYWVGVDHDQV